MRHPIPSYNVKVSLYAITHLPGSPAVYTADIELLISTHIQTWVYINFGCITNCNVVCASHAKHLSWCFSFQSNIEFRMCWSAGNQTWFSFIKGHLLVDCLSICGIRTQSVKIFEKKSYKGGLQFLVLGIQYTHHYKLRLVFFYPIFHYS